MVELRREAVPNLPIVQYADQLLSPAGELLRVVREWDLPRPWNCWRREANRLVTLYGSAARIPPMPSSE